MAAHSGRHGLIVDGQAVPVIRARTELVDGAHGTRRRRTRRSVPCPVVCVVTQSERLFYVTTQSGRGWGGAAIDSARGGTVPMS
jgi:hypothetical protein